MRWEEMSWNKVRRAQMRWSVECEDCSVKCGAWRVQCEVWSVKSELWGVKKAVRSEKWEVWSADCEVWSVECEVRSAKSATWSAKSAVWSVECEECSETCQVWSAKWSFKCDMCTRTPLSQNARTHGLGGRTAHASSIEKKGLIYIYISLRQLPPRLVRVLLVSCTIDQSLWWLAILQVGESM